MEQYLSDAFNHQWTLWLTLAVVCGILELIVPSFSFVFASVAALATALLANWWNLTSQLIVFSTLLLTSLVLIRPRLVAKLHTSKAIPTRTQALLGNKGTVTEAVSPLTGSGRVLIEGEDWAAHSTQDIAVGKSIIVEGSDGIVLKIKEV